MNLFKEKMKTPFVYDGRNCFTLADAKNAGINYQSIGRPEVREFEEVKPEVRV
ncbi:MAG: hypothetical protein ABF649_22000 [Bacillus sp. (in: firmicutes)]